MTRYLPFLQLYRLDVALITFSSYLISALLSGDLMPSDLSAALAISLISINFVYTFNAWADWGIDTINKSHRPIPSGQISPAAAYKYAMGLLLLSVAYPLLLTQQWEQLALFWLLPLLGWLYSAPPLRLKRFPVFAVTTTGLILVMPTIIALTIHEQCPDAISYVVTLFLYCVSIIPLKDIEDQEGDRAYGIVNWSERFGEQRTLWGSMVGLSLTLLMALNMRVFIHFQIYLIFFIISTMLTISGFMLLGGNIRKLYRSIVRIVAAEGLIIFALLSMFRQ